jgi:hypothetical protein
MVIALIIPTHVAIPSVFGSPEKMMSHDLLPLRVTFTSANTTYRILAYQMTAGDAKRKVKVQT